MQRWLSSRATSGIPAWELPQHSTKCNCTPAHVSCHSCWQQPKWLQNLLPSFACHSPPHHPRPWAVHHHKQDNTKQACSKAESRQGNTIIQPQLDRKAELHNTSCIQQCSTANSLSKTGLSDLHDRPVLLREQAACFVHMKDQCCSEQYCVLSLSCSKHST